MKFFLFIQVLIGFILFVHISNNLLKKYFISIKTVIGFAFAFIVLKTLLFYFFEFSVFLFSISCHTHYLTLLSFGTLIKHKRKKDFYNEFSLFLNEVILHMRSGKSFRSGVESAKLRRKEIFQQNLNRIMNVVIFSQGSVLHQDWPLVQRMIHEFKRIHLQSHNALKRLIHFRNKLQFEKHFKQKSSKILAHLRLQSFFLSTLYALLLIFTIWKYGLKSNGKIILISTGLFFIGLFIFIQIGRNLKWKV